MATKSKKAATTKAAKPAKKAAAKSDGKLSCLDAAAKVPRHLTPHVRHVGAFSRWRPKTTNRPNAAALWPTWALWGESSRVADHALSSASISTRNFFSGNSLASESRSRPASSRVSPGINTIRSPSSITATTWYCGNDAGSESVMDQLNGIPEYRVTRLCAGLVSETMHRTAIPGLYPSMSGRVRMPFGRRWPKKYPATVQAGRIGRPTPDRERGRRGTMSLSQFKSNVETAVDLLSRQKKGDNTPLWLNERAIAGMEGCGFEALSADLAFQLGTA